MLVAAAAAAAVQKILPLKRHRGRSFRRPRCSPFHSSPRYHRRSYAASSSHPILTLRR